MAEGLHALSLQLSVEKNQTTPEAKAALMEVSGWVGHATLSGRIKYAIKVTFENLVSATLKFARDVIQDLREVTRVAVVAIILHNVIALMPAVAALPGSGWLAMVYAVIHTAVRNRTEK